MANEISNITFSGPCPVTVLMKALGIQCEIEQCLYRFTKNGTLRYSSRLANGFINDPETCLKIYEACKENA